MPMKDQFSEICKGASYGARGLSKLIFTDKKKMMQGAYQLVVEYGSKAY
jgi:hypothetical protein